MDFIFKVDSFNFSIEKITITILFFCLVFLLMSFLVKLIKFRFFEKNLNKFDTEEDLILELQKGIHLISSITTNSVYVGLFGTVIGILLVLQDINLKTERLISSLSIPLIATAAAIIVAIIGNFISNFLNEYANKILILYTKNAKKAKDDFE